MEVKIDFLGGMKFKARCGKHDVITDVPAEFGGQDEAPTPTYYFLMSLASCVGLYVASYCKNASLDAGGMKITLSADKLQHPSRMDNIKITISLPHTDVEQRKATLLSVAKKCLVHNTIKNHSEIDISFTTSQEGT